MVTFNIGDKNHFVWCFHCGQDQVNKVDDSTSKAIAHFPNHCGLYPGYREIPRKTLPEMTERSSKVQRILSKNSGSEYEQY
jgi:hypothetical protein